MAGNPLGSQGVGFGGEGMGRLGFGGGGGLQQLVDLLYEVDFVDGAGVEGLLAEGLLDGLDGHFFAMALKVGHRRGREAREGRFWGTFVGGR